MELLRGLPPPIFSSNMVQGTADLSGSNLIERLENELVAQTAALDDLLNPGRSTRMAAKQAELPVAENQLMTYKPVISKRAHELPARSFEELSEGDRLRHACYVVSPLHCHYQ